ncbi:hypothetical protein [Caballeronia sp. BR00000012568055]|uniref:hypothetical protein n=1 Tax=Caballeronia sp. BR00000012568055 TaxID=2918761 RepID=UPI0023F83F59|nr:hypothetical protein [Caballeronia sp. BR00000012568055]
MNLHLNIDVLAMSLPDIHMLREVHWVVLQIASLGQKHGYRDKNSYLDNRVLGWNDRRANG